MEILHLSNGIQPFNPQHGEDDIEFINAERPIGRYFVHYNKNGIELLEDLSSDVNMSKRKLYIGVIKPGIRLGFTRDMWRMGNPKNIYGPSILDLYWNYQSPDNEKVLKPLSSVYSQLLRKELAKYCDLLIMTNSSMTCDDDGACAFITVFVIVFLIFDFADD